MSGNIFDRTEPKTEIVVNVPVAGIPGATAPVVLEELRQYADTTLKEEIDRQNKLIDEYIAEDQRRQKAFMNQGVELYEAKAEIKKLKNDSAQSFTNVDIAGNPDFCPCYDGRKFIDKQKKHPSQKEVQRIYDGLYVVVNTVDKDGHYIVKNGVQVAAIFIVLKYSTKIPYRFTGTYSDFAYYWNENITNRIEDCDRARRLTCNEQSLKAEVNNGWAKIPCAEWRISILDGNKYADNLTPALNLKTHIEKQLAENPTICE